MSPRACHYCGVTEPAKGEPFDRNRELRPYGPGGSWVCYPCASTPERREQTEANMGLAFGMAEAASPLGSVVIGAGMAPSPLTEPPPDDAVAFVIPARAADRPAPLVEGEQG